MGNFDNGCTDIYFDVWKFIADFNLRPNGTKATFQSLNNSVNLYYGAKRLFSNV